MRMWWEDGGEAYLVELVAKVDGVDVVAFEIGEHDDLLRPIRREDGMDVPMERCEQDGERCVRWMLSVYRGFASDSMIERWLRTKKTIVKRRTAESRTERRKSQPVQRQR